RGAGAAYTPWQEPGAAGVSVSRGDPRERGNQPAEHAASFLQCSAHARGGDLDLGLPRCRWHRAGVCRPAPFPARGRGDPYARSRRTRSAIAGGSRAGRCRRWQRGRARNHAGAAGSLPRTLQATYPRDRSVLPQIRLGLSAGIHGNPLRRPDVEDAAGRGLVAVSLHELPASAAAAVMLAIAAVMLLLYLLRPAARRMTVSSMVIWRLVLRTRKPTPDRLRWWV